MTERLVLIAATLVLAAIGLLPVAAMLKETLIADGRFSLDAYRALLASGDHLALLMSHSLQLAFLTASLSTLIGVPLGVLLGKTDLPWRSALTLVFAAPLLIPSYVLAVAWFSIVGRTGLLGGILPDAWSREIASAFFGLFGCTFVLASAFMPIAMLLTIAFLRNVNPRARECGKACQRVARRARPNNAAPRSSGNRLCRRAHISFVARRDRRAHVSALSGLSRRDIDAVRRLLRSARRDRYCGSAAARHARRFGIANPAAQAGSATRAADAARRGSADHARNLAAAAVRAGAGICRRRGCCAARRSCCSILLR